jgi:type II secretion system protein G
MRRDLGIHLGLPSGTTQKPDPEGVEHMHSSKSPGFTLIELLIVVAIIAILAAIALPNFLEAQTRSKVSRAKTDMRNLQNGLEMYRIDSNFYPPDTGDEDWSWKFLTTPTAYLGSIPRSPFKEMHSPYDWRVGHDWYIYWNILGDTPVHRHIQKSYFVITCTGPDQSLDCWGHWLFNDPPGPISPNYVETEQFWNAIYDPTNGTVSFGDLVASQKRMY